MFPRFLFCVLLLFSSCQPSSPEDFQMEGVCLMRRLTEELTAVHSRNELLSAEPEIKKIFDKIVDLAIQAAIFQQKHPGEDPFLSVSGKEMSDRLLSEMKRIYAIEGGRECMERAQREAMLRLHAKEKLLRKRKDQSLN